MDCVNCRRVAPSLCTYHIMDLSGCDLDKMKGVPEGALVVYYCPHCGNTVLSTKFCDACYNLSNPASLLQWLVDVPQWRCEDCGAPRIIENYVSVGPCGRCLRREFTIMTPLTPEQLAAWVKEVRCD